MAIVKWNPSLISNMDSFFDDFFKSQFPALQKMNFSAEGTTMPAINIKETDEEYALEVAAPGLVKKDFNISVENGMLTISAEKEVKTEEEEEEEGYTRKEFSYSSFKRSFTLPDGADDSKISAKYIDGILQVVLPKKPEAKPQPAKVIEIS